MSTLDEILDRGEIRLAVEFKSPEETGFPPEMFLDPSTDEPAGVGPELLRLMAADLGCVPRCVDLPWPTHIGSLLDGKVDLILGTNTPRRALEVDFLPGRLMENRVNCLVPTGSDATLPFLSRAGTRIACWHGSTTAEVARRNFPEADIVQAPDPSALLLAGEVDAFVTDSVTYRLVEILGDVSFVCGEDGRPVVLSREYVHFGLRAGDTRFMSWLVNWYDYHDAQGAIEYWCGEYWESFMADAEVDVGSR